MSFQNLRANSPLYILHKDGRPSMECGSVVSVSAPTPKFPIPQTFGSPPEMVVDLVVRVGEQNITYQKLPANQDIADFTSNGMQVISSSRDAMNSEVMSLKQRSIDVINSVSLNQEVVAGCDEILQLLNPEFAEKQKQQADINNLKLQMEALGKSIADVVSMVSSLKEEKGVSSSKKE